MALGEKYGFIDKKGNVVIPFRYDECATGYGFEHGLARVREGENEYYLNHSGERVWKIEN